MAARRLLDDPLFGPGVDDAPLAAHGGVGAAHHRLAQRLHGLGPGHVGDADDCDDADPAVHPGASERCNGADDDCDGLLDALDPSVAD
ncbi:MAG: putative metal-binding motif-containing protein, partial [Myxococcales bacterium]|nr:putative metal-binding motif-containing protein [Myxococcales bacterium]